MRQMTVRRRRSSDPRESSRRLPAPINARGISRGFPSVAIILCALIGLPAFGAARHVYLDTNANTTLNDCPNPSHSFDGTTDHADLFVCVNGAGNNNAVNRIICDDVGPQTCRAMTTTTGICTNPAANNGNIVAVTSGATINVEPTGVGAELDEKVYGSPQACAWNMAQSDSCEVHAGTYSKAGIESAGLGVTPSGCDRSDCWTGTVAFFGYGPNMGTTGYGTNAAPGYLRGAVLNASTDTWDSNSNKIPDAIEGTCTGGTFAGMSCWTSKTECTGGTCTTAAVTSYPVIFDGNRNGNGTNDTTSCGDGVGSCTGDSFYSVMIGAGDTSTNGGFCLSSLSGQTRPQLDFDADVSGTFDTAACTGAPRSVSFLTVKDIEFTNYNGGATTCSGNGIREGLGHFDLAGGGTTSGQGDGIVIDHIYWHDDTYSHLCQQEHYVAVFGDDENWACSSAVSTIPGTGGVQVAGTIVSNSLVVSNNRSIVNDDCDATQPGASECGCSKYFVNNVFVLSNNDGTCSGGSNPGVFCLVGGSTCTGGGTCTSTKYQNFMRWKSVNTVGGGTRPKRIVWTNDQFIVQRGDAGGSTYMFTPECTGLCDPYHVAQGAQGVIQLNGSLIRYQGTAPAIHRFSESFCGDTFRFCENGTTPCSGTGVQAACAGIGGGTCSITEAAGVNWTYRSFLNTFDMEKIGGGSTPLDYICNTNGLLHVSRNNAYWGMSSINTESATTLKQLNDVCSVSGYSGAGCPQPTPNARTDWWTVGTQNAPIAAGLADYIPKLGGPLYEQTANNACDPDGDGALGVDYYGTGGSQITTWLDIAGNTVSCPTLATAISFGARQPNSDVSVVGRSLFRGVSAKGVTKH